MASHIYYNARLTATTPANQTAPPLPCRFEDNRNLALLKNASDYKMSIIRFSVTLQSLPALIIDHINDTTTSYSFTVSKGVNSITVPVKWNPANILLTPNTRDTLDPYFYEYSYIRFINLFVNPAIAAAMAQLIVLDPTITAPAPQFTYNTATAIISLLMPVAFTVSNVNPANNLYFYADTQAQRLFTGFPVIPTGIINKEYQYQMLIQPNESSILASAYYVREQIPGSLSSWNPVKRFCFTTDNLPVRNEQITSPTPYYNTGQVFQSPSQALVCDMTPQTPRGDELRSGTLEYLPSAEYRFVDLTSSGELKLIDINLYWEDHLGVLHQHYLLDNGFMSIKFLFQSKL